MFKLIYSNDLEILGNVLNLVSVADVIETISNYNSPDKQATRVFINVIMPSLMDYGYIAIVDENLMFDEEYPSPMNYGFIKSNSKIIIE